MQKLILHIPHSSQVIPVEYQNDFFITGEALKKELFAMTDIDTQELFPKGYQRIIFPVSRLVCDPERFREDEKEPMAGKGMGAVYTHGFKGERIKRVLQREKILQRFYDPHHEAFTTAVKNALTQYPSCCIIDCHSFSKNPLPYEDHQSLCRPDICIGTDSFHTSEEIKKLSENFFIRNNYSVAFNDPYAGTIVPMAFYQKNNKVRSVMIEVNRGLYLDHRGNHSTQFSRLQKDLKIFCFLLSQL